MTLLNFINKQTGILSILIFISHILLINKTIVLVYIVQTKSIHFKNKKYKMVIINNNT